MTYSVTDIHGNSTSSSFTVTVTDDEDPAISPMAADETYQRDGGEAAAFAAWLADFGRRGGDRQLRHRFLVRRQHGPQQRLRQHGNRDGDLHRDGHPRQLQRDDGHLHGDRRPRAEAAR